MAQSRAHTPEKNGTTPANKPGVVHLSDLAIEGQKFDLEGKVYQTETPISMNLPKIAKVDKMGKEINKWLPAFGAGDYDNVDMDRFDQILTDLVVEVSNVPVEVASKAHWWQRLLIIGLFQSSVGMDFLAKQLPQLSGIPDSVQSEIKAQLEAAAKKTTETPTSPNP